MREMIRVEGADGVFVEREATEEEVAQMASQRKASSEPSPGSPSENVDILRAHAVAITDRELKAIIYYDRAHDAGRLVDATKLWALNSLAEHFRAVLPPNPADRSDDETQVLEGLDRIADEANAAFDASEDPYPSLPGYPYTS